MVTKPSPVCAYDADSVFATDVKNGTGTSTMRCQQLLARSAINWIAPYDFATISVYLIYLRCLFYASWRRGHLQS
jgi:hypothetical protein